MGLGKEFGSGQTGAAGGAGGGKAGSRQVGGVAGAGDGAKKSPGSVGGKGNQAWMLGGPVGSVVSGLDAGGSAALAKLSPGEQAWTQTQAGAVITRGTFTATDHLRLESLARSTFPSADATLLAAAVRFLALQRTTGGSLSRLYSNPRGLTPLQQQLLSA